MLITSSSSSKNIGSQSATAAFTGTVNGQFAVLNDKIESISSSSNSHANFENLAPETSAQIFRYLTDLRDLMNIHNEFAKNPVLQRYCGEIIRRCNIFTDKNIEQLFEVVSNNDTKTLIFL